MVFWPYPESHDTPWPQSNDQIHHEHSHCSILQLKVIRTPLLSNSCRIQDSAINFQLVMVFVMVIAAESWTLTNYPLNRTLHFRQLKTPRPIWSDGRKMQSNKLEGPPFITAQNQRH